LIYHNNEERRQSKTRDPNYSVVNMVCKYDIEYDIEYGVEYNVEYNVEYCIPNNMIQNRVLFRKTNVQRKQWSEYFLSGLELT
jgi:hypothetical protein